MSFPPPPPPPPPTPQYYPAPAHYAPPPATSPLVLDVIARFEYRGHRGKHYQPPSMQGAERRLRITIDDTRTASSIKDEVLARKDMVPAPYEFLGALAKSQGGFELGDNDLVRYIATRGEHVQVIIHYRKDASKGYHVEKGGCSVM